MTTKHALILGSSGIIGFPLSQQLILRSDWKITGVARKDYDHRPKEVDLVTCDLTNAQECDNKLGNLKGITHIFYVTWVSRPTEEENCKVNREMFQNVLTAVQKADNCLQYVYLQTGTKHYGNWIGPKYNQRTPAREEDPRLNAPIFYYDQEDVLFKQNQGKSWAWNIARPPTIIGFTIRTVMNLGMTIAVYAHVLKESGQPLIFPYSQTAYHAVREFVDSRLLCRFIEWMAPDDIRKGNSNRKLVANEAFNIHNGDYYRMENLWPQLAAYFGMEAKVADKPTTVHEIMKGKDDVWDKVVQKHGLKPYKMQDMVTWDFMHQTLSREWDELSIIQKTVKAGYHEQINTDTMFVNFFDGLKNSKIIPGESPERTQAPVKA
jgi:nucleoside-diphosphate-sugar epimerase